jgi:hypothetical protein
VIKLLKSQFGLAVVWATLLAAFPVLRPRPGSGLFLFLLVCAFAAGLAYMWRSRAESRASQDAWKAWQVRVDALAAIIDVEDDGHVYEWLDPPQWEEVFFELERMPINSRSLRKAMSIVAPELRQA